MERCGSMHHVAEFKFLEYGRAGLRLRSGG